MQTTGALADPFDYDAMRDAGIRHGENLERFARMYPEALVLGAGPCERCRACAYPEGPCRCPEGPRFSMEAAGIIVSEVCAAHNLPYYRGPNTITYTACALSGIR
jgi:predicted metal-binding protein